MTTTFPTARPSVNEWLRYVNIPQLNLNLIDDSLSGIIIKEGYKLDPYATIAMIRDMRRDNPTLTEKVISSHNFKLIFP